MSQAPTESEGASGGVPPGPGTLDRHLCQVVGLNQNYTSMAGTLYHIQIEDRGPVMDSVRENEVRRINLIVYANYGELNARIIYGRDHDFPDVRTQDYNRVIEQRIQELASQARAIIEEKEQRQVFRIKCLIREYYLTRDEEHKREFEQANSLYPFLFSRAFRELRAERAAQVAAGLAPAGTQVASPEPEASASEVLYPLDAELRERVLDIERIIIELAHDVQKLKASGGANDIILQTCRKLVARAKDSITGKDPSEFSLRRLEMTRHSLTTTWRQVRSLLK